MGNAWLGRNRIGLLRCLPALLILAIAMACQSVAEPVDASKETGIEGTALMGPVVPGPSTPGQVDETPLAASFSVYSGDSKVAEFRSDSTGRFKVPLPPGDYTIVPAGDTPVPRPETQVTRVSVPATGYQSITIRLDTGMR